MLAGSPALSHRGPRTKTYVPVAERVPLLRAGANELAGKQDSAHPDHGPGVMAFAALPDLLVHRLQRWSPLAVCRRRADNLRTDITHLYRPLGTLCSSLAPDPPTQHCPRDSTSVTTAARTPTEATNSSSRTPAVPATVMRTPLNQLAWCTDTGAPACKA